MLRSGSGIAETLSRIPLRMHPELSAPKRKCPRVGNPRAFASPREIGVADLPAGKSAWNEVFVLARSACVQGAHSRAVAFAPQSVAWLVEEGKFHVVALKKFAFANGRARYAGKKSNANVFSDFSKIFSEAKQSNGGRRCRERLRRLESCLPATTAFGHA